MTPQALALWDALEFRAPATLHAIEPLTEDQIRWQPPNGANSIAWLLWHIPEVEDNWVREKLLGAPKRFPFGVSVKAGAPARWPPKTELVAYFREVREISRQRLEQMSDPDFDRAVVDDTYGTITARQVWAGVATSGAYHGGQIVMIARRLLGAVSTNTQREA